MWHRSKHRRSWCKKHSLDILTAVGSFILFGLPFWMIMLGIL